MAKLLEKAISISSLLIPFSTYSPFFTFWLLYPQRYQVCFYQWPWCSRVQVPFLSTSYWPSAFYVGDNPSPLIDYILLTSTVLYFLGFLSTSLATPSKSLVLGLPPPLDLSGSALDPFSSLCTPFPRWAQAFPWLPTVLLTWPVKPNVTYSWFSLRALVMWLFPYSQCFNHTGFLSVSWTGAFLPKRHKSKHKLVGWY